MVIRLRINDYGLKIHSRPFYYHNSNQAKRKLEFVGKSRRHVRKPAPEAKQDVPERKTGSHLTTGRARRASSVLGRCPSRPSPGKNRFTPDTVPDPVLPQASPAILSPCRKAEARARGRVSGRAQEKAYNQIALLLLAEQF